MARGRLGRDRADGLVGLLFLGIPLLASPWSWDQFTTVKWYALEALAALWLALECFRRGSWPAWIARARAPLLVLGVLGAVNLGRGGWGWALTPLGERVSVLALAWCAFRYARRRRHPLRWPARATMVAALFTNALGTAQILGWKLPYLTAGDGRSALFGNVNMAAQFLGWAFALLVIARPRRGVGLARPLQELLLAWTGAHLYFLSCRSVWLGLGLALALLLGLRRVSLWPLLRIGAGAALLVAALLHSGAATGYLDEARRHKGLAASQRLVLWEATLALAADHPLGVGPSNFTHAFPPYQIASGLPRDEAVEYRHPHNELLRVLAEEGWAFTAVGLVVGGWLLVSLARSRRVWSGRTEAGAFLWATGAFLGVEAAFQFPLAVAFGALAFAWWLGMALAALEPLPSADEGDDGSPRRVVPAAAIALTAAGIAAVVARAAWSEYLFVNRAGDHAAQARACRLDPRNLPACVNAAWLEDASGQPDAARARLLAVLERSPYYGPALKLLGEIALSAGEDETGCFYLWLYDALYRGASSVHSRTVQSCRPDWLASYAQQQPIPYYGPCPRRGTDVTR
jgi:hypothetical protein